MRSPIDLAGAPLTIFDVESELKRRWEEIGRTFGFLLVCSPPNHRIVSSFVKNRPVSLIHTHFGPLTVYPCASMPNDRVAIHDDITAPPIAIIVNFDQDLGSYPWI